MTVVGRRRQRSRLVRRGFILLRWGWRHPHLPMVLGFLGLVIMLPSLHDGWVLDDRCQRSELLDPSRLSPQMRQWCQLGANSDQWSSAAEDLFAFIRPENVQPFIESGRLNWWHAKTSTVCMWRPLASLTQWLDYRLFPDSAPLMHLHSLLWFAAAVGLVLVLYRQVMGVTWIAGLAALFYLLDENYYYTASFIANRNAWLALVFGLLAVLAYHRWRTRHSRIGAVAAPCCLALSLLSGEAGVATMGYLVAYALVLEDGRWRARLLALVPCLVVVGVWQVVYQALGYGANAGAIYLSPGVAPLRYAWVMLERAPILLLCQWGLPPAEAYNLFSDTGRVVYWVGAVLYLGVLLAAFWPLLRESRTARFWGLGMLLAVVPLCGTFTASRNLVFVGVGAMGLAAQFVAGVFGRRASWVPESCLYRRAAWAVGVLLLVMQVGVALFGHVSLPIAYPLWTQDVEAGVRQEPLTARPDQDLVVVNAPNPFLFYIFPDICEEDGRPLPRSVRVLAAALAPEEVTRVDARTLRLRAETASLCSCEQRINLWPHRAYFVSEWLTMVRDRTSPMRVGDRVDLPRLSIEVVAVDGDGLPSEALFRFGVPLDDPSLHWVRWDWGERRYVPFRPPAIGESVALAGPFSG